MSTADGEEQAGSFQQGFEKGRRDVELFLDDLDISFKPLVQASEATTLQFNQIINVDEMVAESHLILLLGFIQVTIKHLQNGMLGVDFLFIYNMLDFFG